MNRTLAPLTLATLLAGCAGMQRAYEAQLDHAVVITPGVDQRAYRTVGIDRFVCSAADVGCDPSWEGGLVAAMSVNLGRVGYQVSDTPAFQAWVESPPPPEPEGNVGMSMSVGPDGVAVEAHGGGAGMAVGMGPGGVQMGAAGPGAVVTASAGPGGASVYAGPGTEIVVYDSLPPEERVLVARRCGVAGVLEGHVSVGALDEVTGWREVILTVRLIDARSGNVAWQGEWREQADRGNDPASIGEALRTAADRLGEGMQRKISVR